MNLGRKQAHPESGAWTDAMRRAREAIDRADLDRLIDQTVDRVRREKQRGRLAYGWSGGKDSQALRFVMEQAGVDLAVLGMTVGLEWPAMLRWQTDHLPLGCDIIARPLDLAWLRAHPAMLFPQGRYGPHWFHIVQHASQRLYVKRERVAVLALGRRRKDGNYVGPPGEDRYRDKHGTTRWAPLADWTHEEVFALLDAYRLPLPPCYDWPRGYQVGTGAWPARQFTRNPDQGFAESWTIDASVIRAAAPELPAAAAWMARRGLT